MKLPEEYAALFHTWRFGLDSIFDMESYIEDRKDIPVGLAIAAKKRLTSYLDDAHLYDDDLSEDRKAELEELIRICQLVINECIPAKTSEDDHE